ncbi:MAG: response regulator transcription factor [Candidatus Marinarcus sp.]|uniref:response regulator transcription factor n=1 Tax=Candidatus Marinarcus sp. TaxID=3100987 RepID=UPI003B004259
MIENYTLLYAQGNDAKRDDCLSYLKGLCKNVYDANSGKQAWELYKDKKPQLLILDMNLSEMNGLELAQKIRDLDKKSKIVILTKDTNVEELLVAIKLNLTEYIIKPINAADLGIIVRRAVDELKEDDHKVNLLELANNFYWDKKLDKLYKNSKEIKLTKKETELLKLLSSRLNSTVSTEDIMNFIYDDTVCSTSKFRTLLYRLKLKVNYELIESVYAIGYRLKVKNKK